MKSYTQESRWQLVAICMGVALSALTSGAMQFWISALNNGHLLDKGSVGSLAAGEYFAIALGTLCRPTIAFRFPANKVALLAGLMIGAANALAAFYTPETFIAGRLLSGFSTGLLSATIIGVVARRNDAVRVFALSTGASLLAISGMTFLLSAILADGGLIKLLSFTALVGILSAVPLALALPSEAPVSTKLSAHLGSQSVCALLASAGYACIGLGMGVIEPYQFVIGSDLGLAPPVLGHVLAAATPVGVLGSILAYRIGNRYGLLRPLLLSLLLFAANWFLFVRATTPLRFGLTFALDAVALGFFPPYANAVIGQLDPSTRIVSAAGLFFLVGEAVGTKIGTFVRDIKGDQALALVGALLIASAMSLFAIAVSCARDRRWNRSNRPARSL